jgi:hypothetical protein
MLQNPNNRKRSYVKQPTPFDGHDKVAPKVSKKDKSSGDDEFFRAVDQRMASKSSSTSLNETLLDKASANKIAKLEERINELEELVTIMMKQQMKLMKE